MAKAIFSCFWIFQVILLTQMAFADPPLLFPDASAYNGKRDAEGLAKYSPGFFSIGRNGKGGFQAQGDITFKFHRSSAAQKNYGLDTISFASSGNGLKVELSLKKGPADFNHHIFSDLHPSPTVNFKNGKVVYFFALDLTDSKAEEKLKDLFKLFQETLPPILNYSKETAFAIAHSLMPKADISCSSENSDKPGSAALTSQISDVQSICTQVRAKDFPLRLPSNDRDLAQHELNYQYLIAPAREVLEGDSADQNGMAQLEAIVKKADIPDLKKFFVETHWGSVIRDSLQLYKERRISESELSTLNYFSSAILQFIHNRANFGVYGEDSYLDFLPGHEHRFDEKMKAKMELYDLGSQGAKHLQSFFNISGDQLEELRRDLKDAPPLERKIFLMPVPEGKTAFWSPLYGELERVQGALSPISLGGTQKYIVIPSDSIFQWMMRNYAKTTHSQPVTIRHQFGKISAKAIGKAATTHSWIINLQHPALDIFKIADGHFGGPFVFSLHDWYHSNRWAMIPNNDVAAFARIKSIVKQYQEKNKGSQKDPRISSILNALTDGELYFGGSKFNKIGAIFPGEPDQVMSRHFQDFPPELALEILKDMSRRSEDREEGLTEEDKKKTDWEYFLKISSDSLLPFHQRLYELILKGPEGEKEALVALKLIEAIGSKSKETVQKLFSEHSKELDELFKKKIQFLGYAAEVATPEVFNTLLDHSALASGVNERSSTGSTPLMFAAARSKVETIRSLLARGADVNAVDSAGHTALTRAALAGCKECLVAILDTGKVKPEILNNPQPAPLYPEEEIANPLMFAAMKGDEDCVKLLLERGANPRIKSTRDKLTAAKKAALEGHAQVFRILLEAEAKHKNR